MIETDIYTVLSTSTAVSAQVGNRIYALTRPQDDALPAVVYQRVSTSPVVSMLGDSGLDSVRIQISCYARTLFEAKSLSTAVRTAITGAATLKSVTVMVVDGQDPETRNFRVTTDFNLWQRN